MTELTNHEFKIKGGKLWTLTQEYYDELIKTYPLHDVEGEMRKAKLWCRQIGASRRKTAKGMQRFLNGWVSRSEATGHVTKDPEKTVSEMIYEKNLKNHIEQWSNIIHERTTGQLKANKMFMAASQYPEFAKWAVEQRPDLKGAKADVPLTKPEPVAEPPPVVPVMLADIPPEVIECVGEPEALSKTGQILKDLLGYREKKGFISK